MLLEDEDPDDSPTYDQMINRIQRNTWAMQVADAAQAIVDTYSLFLEGEAS